MRDLLQEVGWTNLGCVPNVPPTSIHLFSWNSLENKELCVENLNSPWCAEDGLQYVHLTSPQHVLIFHECHINENSLGKYISFQRLEFEEGGQLLLLRDSLFPGWVASLKSSSVSRCVFRGEPTDCSSVTLFSLRNSSEIKILELVQCSSCRNNWTESSFHPSSVRLRVQLWV